MRKLTTNDKKQILAKLIEAMVANGYDITPYIYKPLSHWDYEQLIKSTVQIHKDGQGMDDEDILEYEQEYTEQKKVVKTIPTEKFEFQVLYGVPMSGWLEKHKANGYKVRVYVPFGKDWYDYSIRRLKENPNIAGYILKNMFRK